MKASVAIAVLGIATLVGLLMPMAAGLPAWITVAWETQRIHAILLVLGVAVPIGVGVWGAVRRPLLRWQAIAATAGFGVVFLKVQIYRGLTRVLDAPPSMQVLTAAVLLGLATSFVAILTAPE